MKLNHFLAALALPALLLAACDDETSAIGGSLVNGQTDIAVDSLFTITGRTVRTPQINAKSTSQMLGHLYCPEYGDLRCSFAAMMMPSSDMTIPDSIGIERVDSIRLKFSVPKSNITGDTLLPQQISVYSLTRNLPSGIMNTFDPTGYYDPATPLGRKNFAPSGVGLTDTLLNSTVYDLCVRMPKSLGLDLFREYRDNPGAFKWPQGIHNIFRGIYVEPSYGRGCVVNVASSALTTYYYYKTTRTQVIDGVSKKVEVIMKDSINMLYSGPEVVSGNIISYTPSESLKARVGAGEAIIASPAGYHVEIDIPAQEILDRYNKDDFSLAVINNLVLSIPVRNIANDFGLAPASQLLMVKTSELDGYFTEGKVPDNISSFYGTFDSETGEYTFTSMREYIVGLMNKGGTVDEADTHFTLLPVSIATETSIYDNRKVIVTQCVPFLVRPTLTRLDLPNAKLKFTYSTHSIY